MRIIAIDNIPNCSYFLNSSVCVSSYADECACVLLRMKLFIKYAQFNPANFAHQQNDDTFAQIESKSKRKKQTTTAMTTKEYTICF